MSWTIREWSRERGCGVATSDLGVLPFEAAVASVDDFVVDEAVHVELEPRGSTYRIAKIWPDDPRLHFNSDGAVSTPDLDGQIAHQIRDVLRDMAVWSDYRIERWDGDLLVHGDDDLFAYGPSAQLIFRGALYVELPAGWNGKSFRLADVRERAYVASKSEVTSTVAVVRIVDDQRIYFVACTGVEYAKLRSTDRAA